MTDKSPLDDQWDDLVNDWQSQPYEKIDIDKLIKKLRRRTIIAKAMLVMDVIATLVLFYGSYWMMKHEPDDLPTIIYLSVGAIGSLIYTAILFKIRIQTWQLDASDPKQYFEKNISGVKGALKIAKLLKYCCYIMTPLINWYLWEVTQSSDKSLVMGFVFANAVIVLMYVGSHIYQRRREVELQNLSELM